jgi:hypothetical protein
MRKTLMGLVVAMGVGVIALLGSSGSADPQRIAVTDLMPTVVIPTEPPTLVPSLEAPDEHPRFDLMKEYVLNAMNSWPHADVHVPTADYDSIASDIATVVLDSREPPIWKDDDSKAKTAIQMAALGYNEGARYAQYVDDGSCDTWMNEAWNHAKKVSIGISEFSGRTITRAEPDLSVLPEDAQKLLAFGDCDGGRARSIFQIHADDFPGGLIIVETDYEEQIHPEHHIDWMNALDYHGDSSFVMAKVHGEDLTNNRQLAVRVALHMARKSIHSGRRLCSYTGETVECPKGEIRRLMAESYSRKHPFVLAIPE